MKWFFLMLSSMFFIPVEAAEQKLIIIRHAEATNNVENVYNSNPSNPNYRPAYLTEKGVQKILETAKELKAQGFGNDNITAVLVSPLPRAKETADLLAKEGLFAPDKIIVDKRLTELQAGDLEGKPVFPQWLPAYAREFHAEAEDQVKKRVQDFYNTISKKYSTGNIVVISHFMPIQDLIEIIEHKKEKINPGEVVVVPLRP